MPLLLPILQEKKIECPHWFGYLAQKDDGTVDLLNVVIAKRLSIACLRKALFHPKLLRKPRNGSDSSSWIILARALLKFIRSGFFRWLWVFVWIRSFQARRKPCELWFPKLSRWIHQSLMRRQVIRQLSNRISSLQLRNRSVFQEEKLSTRGLLSEKTETKLRTQSFLSKLKPYCNRLDIKIETFVTVTLQQQSYSKN